MKKCSGCKFNCSDKCLSGAYDDDSWIIAFYKKKRIEELEDAEDKLDALEKAGVDNWQGYDNAMEIYNESRKH